MLPRAPAQHQEAQAARSYERPSTHVRAGPFPLPSTGCGAVTHLDRDRVFNAIGVSIADRKRPGWSSRVFTLSGPSARIEEARAMAEEIILLSQRSSESHSFEFNPWGPGGETNSTIKFKFYVIGLQQIGMGPRMDDGNELIQRVRQRSSRNYEIDRIDQVVDARWFHYPRVAWPHIGEHILFLENVVRHDLFQGWLSMVKANFDNRSSTDTHVIATYCRQGIHMSVGCCRILAEIFKILEHDVEEQIWCTQFRSCRNKYCTHDCYE